MNQSQKKFILKVLIVLLSTISLGLLVCFIIAMIRKDTLLSILTGAFSIFSPATLIGIIIKYIMNENHLKNIRNILDPKPTTTNENKTEYIFENIKFKEYKKDNKIVIIFPKENVSQELVSKAILEYLEQKRREQI